MGIFSRKKSKDTPDTDRSAVESTDLDEDLELDDVDDESADDDADESGDTLSDDDAAAQVLDEAAARRLPRPASVDRSAGPFDRAEVDDLDERLDLGALVLTPQPGAELRLDVDEQGQTITGVTAVQDESAVQLQVFAAPKSSGVWDDIRDEIADNLISAGGTADEVMGDLGIELHARMPARGPDGRTTYSPVRFVGVDGPRWFLRAVLSGRAAIDDEAAAAMLDVVRSTVVSRGEEARAPRELLELTIPAELMNAAEQEQAAADPSDVTPQSGDFAPFERGPEITEIR